MRECLESVLNQTYDNIEIIVVNDGSTDNSLSIIEEYAGKSEKIIVINQENKGFSGARNAALKCATGDYVGFVDSDDRIAPNMYERMVSTAVEKDADIVACSYWDVYEINGVEKISTEPNSLYSADEEIQYDTSKLLLEDVFLWKRIYKKALLSDNNILFPDDIYFSEDAYFHRRALLCAKKVVYIKDALYYYRVGRQGAQTTLGDERKFLFLPNCERLYSFVDKEKADEIYPYLNRLTLGLGLHGYADIDEKYKKEYYNRLVALIKKLPFEYGIACPEKSAKDIVFKIKGLVLMVIYPFLYEALKHESRLSLEFITFLRGLCLKIAGKIKKNKTLSREKF